MAATRERTGDRIIQPYLFAIVSITKYHRKLQPRTMGTYFLTVLEAGHPRSRCWPVWFLLRPLAVAHFSLCPHMVLPLWACEPVVSPCVQTPSCRDLSDWVRSLRNGHILPHYLFKGSILQIQSPREIPGVRILPVSPTHRTDPSSPLSCPLIFCCDSLLAEPNWNLRPCIMGRLPGPRAGGEGWRGIRKANGRHLMRCPPTFLTLTYIRFLSHHHHVIVLEEGWVSGL